MAQNKWHKEIKAWADGAEIEMRVKSLNKWGDWEITYCPGWHTISDIEYRVKPQPKLVPFDFSDAEQLIGKAVRNKYVKKLQLIVHVGDSVILSNNKYPTFFSELLKNYEFLDGSPCGKYVNE